MLAPHALSALCVCGCPCLCGPCPFCSVCVGAPVFAARALSALCAGALVAAVCLFVEGSPCQGPLRESLSLVRAPDSLLRTYRSGLVPPAPVQSWHLPYRAR